MRNPKTLARSREAYDPMYGRLERHKIQWMATYTHWQFLTVGQSISVSRAEAYLVDLQSNDSDGGDVGHQKRQAPVTRPDWQPCASEVWS